MRKTPLILAAAVTVVSAGCYKDFDFGIDGKADYAVTDSSGVWTDLTTSKVIFTGAVGDLAVPEDWDADGFADKAVVRANGDWVTDSTLGTISFPRPAELPAYAAHSSLTRLPVPGDYDGDGDIEAAWYRESDGNWFIQGQSPVDFGNGPTALPGAGTLVTENDYDYPVPADYDGDLITDLSVFNPWTGSWRVRQSSNGAVTNVVMSGNQAMAMPVPADYDKVGHAQRAVYGPNGWFIEGHATPDLFGAVTEDASDTGYPAVADFDGDGRADLSYISYGTSFWNTKGSLTAPVSVNGDQWPVPTGVNLRANLGRLSQLGICYEFPDFCTSP